MSIISYSKEDIGRIYSQRIDRTDISQQGIQGFTAYLFMNIEFIDVFVDCFSKKIQEAQPTFENYQQILKYLYMANDIIQKSKDLENTAFRAFTPLFEQILIKVAKTKDKGLIGEASVIINVFERRKIFAKSFISRLKVQMSLNQDESIDSKGTIEFLNMCDLAAQLAEEYQNLEGGDPEKIVENLKKQRENYSNMMTFHSEGIKNQSNMKNDLQEFSEKLDESAKNYEKKIVKDEYTRGKPYYF